MSEKQIDTANIQNIHASIASEGTIAFETGTTASSGVSSGDYTPYWVEDDSQEKLGACLKSIYLDSQQIEETVTNYNDYINSVAEAFKAQDQSLAGEIDNVMTSSMKAPKTASASMTAEEKVKVRSSEATAILGEESPY